MAAPQPVNEASYPPTWVCMPILAHPEYTRAAIADVLAQSVPVRLLLINQGVDNVFWGELERIAEADDRVFLWNHLPPLPSLAATWNRALDYVWEVGGDVALVVNNDVRLWSGTINVLRLVCRLPQAQFVSCVGVTEQQFEAFLDAGAPLIMCDDPDAEYPQLAKGGPDFSCFLIHRECHRRYRFDEAFTPAFCVTPDTPILTKDLDWVAIDTIKVGDEIIGVDEEALPRGEGEHHRRCYRVATVLSTSRRHAQCLQFWLADGRTVVCSIDHKWLTKYPTGGAPFRWRAANTLSIGYRIAAPLDVWSSPYTYDHGWLAGIMDGEGCLRQRNKNRLEINIAQKEGIVLDEIKSMLTRCKIPFTWRIRSDNSVGVVEIGQRRHVLRALGEFRPKRLLDHLEWKDLSTFSRSAEAGVAIVGIRPVGEQEVVTIETSTRTYLAAGMIAHNCEDLDYHRRLLLAGVGDTIFSVNLPYLHYGSATIKSVPDRQRQAIEAGIQAGSRAHYQRKWGGPVNQERFAAPYGPSADRDVTTPTLQATLGKVDRG